MTVVSNTSPIHYLILIGAERILPALYGGIVIPAQVLQELEAERTPHALRAWLADRPAWLEVQTVDAPPAAPGLHPGEAAAIALARRIGADLLLIDDKDGRTVALSQGLRIAGVLGVLRDAAGEV